MRNIILCSLLFIIFLSCKKDKVVRSLEKDLLGTWELYSTNDALGYMQYQLGLGYSIMYKKQGVFERRSRNLLVFKGSYSLTRKSDCLPRASDVYLTTDEPASVPNYAEVKNDTLYLSKSNCNGVNSVEAYRRIN